MLGLGRHLKAAGDFADTDAVARRFELLDELLEELANTLPGLLQRGGDLRHSEGLFGHVNHGFQDGLEFDVLLGRQDRGLLVRLHQLVDGERGSGKLWRAWFAPIGFARRGFLLRRLRLGRLFLRRLILRDLRLSGFRLRCFRLRGRAVWTAGFGWRSLLAVVLRPDGLGRPVWTAGLGWRSLLPVGLRPDGLEPPIWTAGFR